MAEAVNVDVLTKTHDDPTPPNAGDLHLAREQDDADDRSEIIRVIEKETSAWILRDQAAWESCWVREDHAQHISARPQAGAVVLPGFNDIRSRISADMLRIPDAGLSPDEIRRENWQFRIGSDMAWVTFNQIAPVTAPSCSAPGFHKQVRIMEKVDGLWLIAAVIQIHGRLGFYNCPWVRVDTAARVLQMSDGAESVLREHRALQLIGGHLRGRTRANDRLLGQKLLEAEKGKYVCEPTTPVVFTHDDDGNYSLCWISTSDDMIVVLLDDGSFTEQSIEAAGKLYALTRAQVQVAKEIAGGRDLPQAAHALGIQANTIRTHVKRMFEKVGVNGQSGLMRALLSVGPPSVDR